MLRIKIITSVAQVLYPPQGLVVIADQYISCRTIGQEYSFFSEVIDCIGIINFTGADCFFV
jgi:hypothetical protein